MSDKEHVGGEEIKPEELAEMLYNFDQLEESISNARAAYGHGGRRIDEAIFHLIHARGRALDIIKQIGYPRYEPIKTVTIREPEPKIEDLRVCPICGNPFCGSDHK
jgi:hypothetical protein